jgi:hypothetical protein
MADVPLRRRARFALGGHQVGGNPGLPVHDDLILVLKTDFNA